MTLHGFRSKAMREFEEFDKANPDFYPTLVRFARQARRSGKDVYSISPIIARARWAFDIETHRLDEKSFKINDHVAPYYARMMMYRERDLRGFFHIRDTIHGEPDLWLGRIKAGTITKWW